jgi:50S ribosomal protein L16 3-hydroxylase
MTVGTPPDLAEGFASSEQAAPACLLGTHRQVFLDDYYLRQPFALPGKAIRFARYGNWDVIAEILAQPSVDLIAAHRGRQRPDVVDSVTVARRLLVEGCTLAIRRAHRNSAVLNRLAQEFEQAFGGDTDIHLVVTPACEPGFGWHYDAEEVFILQTAGSKTWKLRKNTVNPWPLIEAIPRDQRYERELSPVMTCRLEAGDWLYIPSGYWHATEAGEEESISLSIGVRPTTAIDIFDDIRSRLLGSMLWRQRLPCAGKLSTTTTEERAAVIRDMCRQLSGDLAEWLTSEFLADAFARREART